MVLLQRYGMWPAMVEKTRAMDKFTVLVEGASDLIQLTPLSLSKRKHPGTHARKKQDLHSYAINLPTALAHLQPAVLDEPLETLRNCGSVPHPARIVLDRQARLSHRGCDAAAAATQL